MKLSFLNYTGHGQCSHKSQNHKASQIAADNKLSTTAFDTLRIRPACKSVYDEKMTDISEA